MAGRGRSVWHRCPLGGAVGNRRATVVARLLSDAGIRGKLTQSFDGAWEIRVGPVPGGDVARVIDQFVW